MQNRANIYGITQQQTPFRDEAIGFRCFLEKLKITIEQLKSSSFQDIAIKPGIYFKQFGSYISEEALKHTVCEIISLKCPDEMPYYFYLCSPEQIREWAAAELGRTNGEINLDLTRLLIHHDMNLVLPDDVATALTDSLVKAEKINLLADGYSYQYHFPSNFLFPKNKHISFDKREVPEDKRNAIPARSIKVTLHQGITKLITLLDPASLDLRETKCFLISDLLKIQRKKIPAKWPLDYSVSASDFEGLSILLQGHESVELDFQRSNPADASLFAKEFFTFLEKTNFKVDILRLPEQIRKLSNVDWLALKQKIIDTKHISCIEVRNSAFIYQSAHFARELNELNRKLATVNSLKRTVLTFFWQNANRIDKKAIKESLPDALVDLLSKPPVK